MSFEMFGVRLKHIRETRGVTQEALAKRVGITRAYLSRLEMGRHDPPLSRLRKLAKALKISIADLVE